MFNNTLLFYLYENSCHDHVSTKSEDFPSGVRFAFAGQNEGTRLLLNEKKKKNRKDKCVIWKGFAW